MVEGPASIREVKVFLAGAITGCTTAMGGYGILYAFFHSMQWQQLVAATVAAVLLVAMWTHHLRRFYRLAITDRQP